MAHSVVMASGSTGHLMGRISAGVSLRDLCRMFIAVCQSGPGGYSGPNGSISRVAFETSHPLVHSVYRLSDRRMGFLSHLLRYFHEGNSAMGQRVISGSLSLSLKETPYSASAVLGLWIRALSTDFLGRPEKRRF